MSQLASRAHRSGSQPPAAPTDIELRALRALRRAGSRGLLHQHLLERMRPARPRTRRAALQSLERQQFIEYCRDSRIQARLQGAWRITDRGRRYVDLYDLPPAA